MKSLLTSQRNSATDKIIKAYSINFGRNSAGGQVIKLTRSMYCSAAYVSPEVAHQVTTAPSVELETRPPSRWFQFSSSLEAFGSSSFLDFLFDNFQSLELILQLNATLAWIAGLGLVVLESYHYFQSIHTAAPTQLKFYRRKLNKVHSIRRPRKAGNSIKCTYAISSRRRIGITSRGTRKKFP